MGKRDEIAKFIKNLRYNSVGGVGSERGLCLGLVQRTLARVALDELEMVGLGLTPRTKNKSPISLGAEWTSAPMLPYC